MFTAEELEELVIFKMGEEKGLEKGLQKGLEKALQRTKKFLISLLISRFSPSEEEVAAVRALVDPVTDMDVTYQLLEVATKCGNLKEFMRNAGELLP